MHVRETFAGKVDAVHGGEDATARSVGGGLRQARPRDGWEGGAALKCWSSLKPTADVDRLRGRILEWAGDGCAGWASCAKTTQQDGLSPGLAKAGGRARSGGGERVGVDVPC